MQTRSPKKDPWPEQFDGDGYFPKSKQDEYTEKAMRLMVFLAVLFFLAVAVAKFAELNTKP